MRHQPEAASQRPGASRQTSQDNVQGLPDPVHVPPEQDDVVVHQAPSSHGVPSAAFRIEQTPVGGSHRLWRQVVSLPVSQVTMVPGSTEHRREGSQYSVPLQRFPSSYGAHSAVVAHSQTEVPPPHPPLAVQVSPLVHGSPSSQESPVRGDHEVRLTEERQAMQSLPGWRAPSP
jgi:hypothetical protein